ncbi:cellobiose phosphorylase [Clostridium saccharoperbutylacetonicum]|uniref:Cellobiose phosphorylase n=1 Tax=Clostridium saccharoperbutylacetonicum N1-4(HMT) TaxID=931276 RepID=M1MMS9_9CLOT|nr:glucoamylase family protein [Clostridium saccharoperbutylacetonicum]AGF59194.1 cellobiose phosphorylase [Clostridium saccharoperbutylacetonicum N1-4(HMT)]NRT60019.1 cellobiose phosphorylase [Clostridium saccharoperbutylacetonicum]NSB23331.1 cellobiose phosphorylase [Clostridium saccharoperbutylacetonicum]NSB42701.1 cellobiose phosphorylase [Clostridium saccharoperbutylacetonicum]
MKMNNSYGVRKNVLRELAEGFSCIHENFRYFSKLSKNGYKVLGASEWLLDNIYLIEKEYKAIKVEMPIDYFKGLDCINEVNYNGNNNKGHKSNNRNSNANIEINELVPRIFVVAKNYINEGNEIDCDKFISYINELQEDALSTNSNNKQTAFTTGELWAFPLMLKIAIIINLSKYTNELVGIQKEIIRGKTVAEKVIDSINNGKFNEEVQSIVAKNKNIGPLFLREFLRVLRDNSIEDGRIEELVQAKWKINIDINDNNIKSDLREETLERNIGEYITSIRKIEGISWRRFFENTSLVEGILKRDPENVYNNMDFETKDYYRHKLETIARTSGINEIDLANNILELAEISKISNEESYKCHVGYYLIDDGVKRLKAYKNSKKVINSEPVYVAFNVFGTLIISFLILFIINLLGGTYTRTEYIISFLVILIPVNEIIVGLINYTVSKIIDIKLVPKLNISKGVPDESKTVVVIPAIVNSKEKVQELMSKLEVAYLGNRDRNLYFALLSDFYDSEYETEKNDAEIIKCGIECARRLNEKYSHFESRNDLNIEDKNFKNRNSLNIQDENFEDKNELNIEDNNEDKFFFLSRRRIYNKKQNIFMGRERKRGKLMEFMALIRNNKEHTFNVFSSNIKPLRTVKYLITLDEDTFMPRESAFKLIGAMSHVLNIPQIKDGRVIRGYGIMQPKVSISLEAKNQTYFSRIFGGEGGVDGYSVAYSDTYQDLFGEGSFTGKGIISIDEFYKVLHTAIDDDTILSHDLLEGGIARCALVSDVEFIDGYPSSYAASSKRLHRWVRGDWQLIGWLFSNNISLLYKWKIFDNLRRSLLAPNLLCTLILSLTVLSGRSQIAFLVLLASIISLVFTVTDFVVTPKNKLMGTFKNFEQIMLIVSFIPYQAFLMLDAILITLFRVIFSRRNLLEWQSAEFVEKRSRNDFGAYLKGMWIAPVMGLLVLYLSFYSSFGVIAYNIFVAGLWISSPYLAYCISAKFPEHERDMLQNEEKTYLRKISRRIYAYYEDFVNVENNYLAPDNYQEKPFRGVANRTSPTNIGMGITSNIVAYDLGYITMLEFIDRIELILNSMKSLQKVNGHFLNWYDTKTKEPLWPRYVSTVDSGNLLGDLWVLKQTMEELKHNKIIRSKEVKSLNDIYKIIEEEDPSLKLKFSSHIDIGEYLKVLNEILFKLEGLKAIEKLEELEELNDNTSDLEHTFKEESGRYTYHIENTEADYWINKLTNEVRKKIEHYELIFGGLEKLYSKEFFEGVPDFFELIHRCEEYKNKNGDNFKCILGQKVEIFKNYINKMDNIIRDIDNMSKEMDFNFLYDKTRGLFSIGYNVEEKSLGNSYYDLLASESRIASFVSIAKNDVPTAHWFKLGRAMTNAFHAHSLVSWSGTMFEYFMPALIMKNYPRTLLSQTYKSVIKAQISFAKQKKTPWGISESAFYEFDASENYQYKAFGVPGLGLKRGLEDELVISPYSTLMMLPFAKRAGIKNLKELEKLGAIGRYGFIESVDYTKARKDNYIVSFSKDDIFDSIRSTAEDKSKYALSLVGKNYSQNVDNFKKTVDNHDKRVDNTRDKINTNITHYDVEDVHNVDNYDIKTPIVVDKVENDNVNNRSYPQKVNKVVTYMVHHLGMSLMALDNVLLNNILVSRFHSLPEVKATELLLKEKVPQNVTFERNEEYFIKNKYFKGEALIPRVFEKTNQDSPQLLLLCNGEYSSMITVSGSGYSKKNDTMLYRWKGNSTSDDSGMFFYIKNLNSNDYWSSTYEPCKDSGEKYLVELNLDKAKFSRRDGNIETVTEVAVSTEENFEVRKLILKNNGDKGRSIEITSYMEITLATFSADIVHPAFSNLFIQTEYDKEEDILVGSRRPRVKDGKVPYIFHKAVVKGELEGGISYETSRINFIGRNRELKNPQAMDNDKALDNTVGTVLDPIMSVRVRVRLEPNSKREIFYITGICDSKEQVLNLCREYNNPGKLDKVFEGYSTATQLELKNLGIRSGMANIFQSVASNIFFLSNSRKNREEYIKNISKHQKDLWPYGISGDLPIAMLIIEAEEDMHLVFNMVKFHHYLKLKGVKLDLIIYNDEEISYDAPLQKSVIEAIRAVNENNSLNKPGGIFIHSKSTLAVEVKNLLIGISRIYVDKNNNLSSYAYNEKRLNSYMNLDKEGMDSPIALRNNALFKDKYEKGNAIENNIPYEVYDNDEEVINKYDVAKNIEKSVAGNIKQSVEENMNKSIVGNMEKSVVNNIKEAEEQANFTEAKLEEEADLIGLKEVSDNNQTFEEFNMDDLDFFNGYGGFNKEDNSYIIKLSNYKNTPAPWINVISNDDFGFHVSEVGAGYTWCGNSRENKITPWSNDYVRDPLGEGLYIQDKVSKACFSITPKPIRDSGEYLIKHSFGYSEFRHTACDIKGILEVFAPKNEKIKLQRVTLENLSDRDRELSLYYYAKLVLGVYEYDSGRYISTYIVDDNENVDFIGASNPYSEYFGKLNAYLTILGGDNISFTGDNKEFIGINGETSRPKALKRDKLSNNSGGSYDPCLAAATSIKLKKGEKKELVILFGQENRENIEDIINKYKNFENVQIELDKVKQYWRNFLGNIQVKTPDKSLDHLLNGWLLYQTLSCRYLSRSAFYQSGGAYGFRDQLQDSLSLGVVDTEIPKAQILRSASRQYVEGDVQHWWHPVVNSGIRTRFSDDLLWLPYVTAEYINSTGDYEILKARAPYLEDDPLREGEDERYTIVNQSSKEGTIYEHCIKAIEKALKFGIHNIPLMGSGDWNDGMSTVGNEGKGESVWLGWFLYSILNSFIEIAENQKDNETKLHFEERKEFIRENLEKNAWDGGWYRRAYFDDGTPLGSRENPECQIDSLAQSWSIISGAFESKTNLQLKVDGRQRAIEAMEAVDRNLVKKDKAMILLLSPPFSNSKLEPGYIKGYVPGVRENGGQYTHAAVWVILALTKLGLGDKAVKYYNMINPINHTKTELECMNYKVEPYVMAADVYIKEPHAGRGGWSWYTGASGWMYRVGVENILGLRKVKDKGYTIKPCIPKDWNEFEIKITNEKEDYTIKVKRFDKDNTLSETMVKGEKINEKQIQVLINGEIAKDNIIPRNKGKLEIVVYFPELRIEN